MAKSLRLDIIDEDAALSGSSARDLPPAPCSGPPPPRILRLRGKTTQTSKEDEEWPEPDAQKSSKKVSAETARKNSKSARATSTLQEHHLDKKTFDQLNLEFKAGNQSTLCKFSKRVKYDIQVKPNNIGLDWVYSVPCGHKKRRWARASPGSS